MQRYRKEKEVLYSNPLLVRGSALLVFQVTLKFLAGETRLAHPVMAYQ